MINLSKDEKEEARILCYRFVIITQNALNRDTLLFFFKELSSFRKNTDYFDLFSSSMNETDLNNQAGIWNAHFRRIYFDRTFHTLHVRSVIIYVQFHKKKNHDP